MRFAAGDICVVEVSVDGGIEASAEGPDLFEALALVRGQLEVHEVLIGCNGARRDVFPSVMQRQATIDRRAYVLAMPRGASRPSTVDVFAPAPDMSLLGTVDEQRAWFDTWRQSGLA
ncbi:hypothetical protein [Humibacter soli]